MEIKKCRTKTSLLPTLPKVSARGCKPESKSKQFAVFFQNAHTDPLKPSTNIYYCSSTRSQCFTHKSFLNYKFSVQKNQEQQIKQQHFLLNAIHWWHTEWQQGAPVQKDTAVLVSHSSTSKEVREQSIYSSVWFLLLYEQAVKSLNSSITSPDEFSSNLTATINQ